MPAIVRKDGMKKSPFRAELHDFFGFLRSPTLSRRPIKRAASHAVSTDWFGGLDFSRILLWALCLWAINLLVFGPLAAMAAGAAGAQHRLNLHSIPWLQALIWAPIVEELVFRYGLRRPALMLWVVPIAAVCMVTGPVWYSAALVALILLLLMQPIFFPHQRFAYRPKRSAGAVSTGVNRLLQVTLAKRALDYAVLTHYRQHFIWIVYGSTLAFAALHLYNFIFTTIPLWLLPLMVLPQFVTGLVLAWMRVRRGIGAAIVLHAVFNGGPLLLVWLIVRFMPELAA